MKIIYKHGDLKTCDEQYFAHGCNAQGVMGSGVAAWVRSDFPWGYAEYRRVYEEQGNHLEMGQVIVARDPANKSKTVLNCITQEFFGRDPNVVYVDYDAIRVIVEELDKLFDNEASDWEDGGGFVRVAFPLIGAGLANGKWSIISGILEESATFHPVVYLLDGVIPDGVQGTVG